MAQSRVFVSSTFYDLKYIRSDLEKFVLSLGYEPVLHERGSIAYGKSEKLEHYAYKEIELSDILVSIIGGRYGSPSEHSPYSISQQELKKAIDIGKPVYIFIQKEVYIEYRTYLINKGRDIRFKSVDDINVFKFIEEISAMQRNKIMHEFDGVGDIINFLKIQWAGLFQRLLQDQARISEVELINNLRSSAETLDRLVAFMSQKNQQDSHTIREILMFNHPAHLRLRTVLKCSYRTFFLTRNEMENFIKARGFYSIDEESLDDEEWLEYLEKAEISQKNG
jgi:hypothetical protein